MDVKLASTSGHQNSLKQLNRKDGSPSNLYILKTDNTDKVRVGYFNNEFGKSNKISHIDPPGGPRITVGKTIKNTNLSIVECIEFNKMVGKYIITFKQ